MGNRVAIIDLGTNTFHLLIVEITDNGNREKLFSKKIPVKIGEGGISTGIITDEAIARAIKAIAEFKSIIDEYGTPVVKATATSAFRNAKNGVDVAQSILNNTGIEINIIDGHTEAGLIHKGVCEALNIGNDTSVIMDIGGGSVEFIICNHDEVFWQQSFEIGGQRLMDKFHSSDPISPNSRKELMQYLDDELEDLKKANIQFHPTVLIGSSGTFDTLCEIHYQKNGNAFILEDKTEYSLPVDSFFDLNENIIIKDRNQRLAIPGMIPMRVDMIVVACCLIEWVIDNLDLKAIRVSTYALKEGLLSEISN